MGVCEVSQERADFSALEILVVRFVGDGVVAPTGLIWYNLRDEGY